MQPIGNVQQLSRRVRGRGYGRCSVDAQTGGGVPNLDYHHASLRNGGGIHWASITTQRTLRHTFQTHMQCPEMGRHCCDRVSSIFRALDGASTRQFRSHSYLLVVDETSYLVRTITCVFVYCELQSERLYCNLRER